MGRKELKTTTSAAKFDWGVTMLAIGGFFCLSCRGFGQ
jgi:hypothetical protein